MTTKASSFEGSGSNALSKGAGRSRARRATPPATLPTVKTEHLLPSRREQQRRVKVAHLINSALAVLLRDGYAQFSMRAAAAEAGVSLSSLQHYYETKDAFLLDAARIYLSGFIERYTADRSRRRLSPRDALFSILEDLADEVTRPDVGGIFIEIWALGRHDPAIGDLLVGLYEDYRGMFAELLLEVMPDMAPSKANELALLLVAQSEGMVILNYHSGMRSALDGPLIERMKRMWPAIAALDL